MKNIATYAAGMVSLLLLSACAGNAPVVDQDGYGQLAATTAGQEAGGAASATGTASTTDAAGETPDAEAEKPTAEQELAARSRGRTETDGRTYRCRRSSTTGTHMRKRRCRTIEQIEQDRHDADKIIEDNRVGGVDFVRD